MTKPTKWHVRPAKTPISRPVWPVFAVRMKKAWDLSYQLSAQRRLWSDWADAQADLSLCWAHMPLCWFCHEAAQLSWSMAKSAKWPWCPAKTWINLGSCPVWSEFSLGPWRKIGSFAAHEVHSRLFRLGPYPGWSESLLGAQVILFDLSCSRSVVRPT